MYPILFKYFGFTVYTYGLFIAAGFLLGLALAMQEGRKEGINHLPLLEQGYSMSCKIPVTT